MNCVDSAAELTIKCIQRLRGVGILHTAEASRRPGLRTLAPGLFIVFYGRAVSQTKMAALRDRRTPDFLGALLSLRKIPVL
jgi:hypothetical protein